MRFASKVPKQALHPREKKKKTHDQNKIELEVESRPVKVNQQCTLKEKEK